MGDSLFQNLSTVQSNQQPNPKTVAAATTIAPETFITFVSGTTDVGTVTPYVTGTHVVCLIFTNATPGDLLTTGNILVGLTTVAQNAPLFLIYDPIQAKYYVK